MIGSQWHGIIARAWVLRATLGSGYGIELNIPRMTMDVLVPDEDAARRARNRVALPPRPAEVCKRCMTCGRLRANHFYFCIERLQR